MEKMSIAKKEKDIRHIKNLAGYSGFWHGMYFLLGIAQISHDKLKKKGLFSKYGRIYKYRSK
jgi:hypothetical protein